MAPFSDLNVLLRAIEPQSPTKLTLPSLRHFHCEVIEDFPPPAPSVPPRKALPAGQDIIVDLVRTTPVGFSMTFDSICPKITSRLEHFLRDRIYRRVDASLVQAEAQDENVILVDGLAPDTNTYARNTSSKLQVLQSVAFSQELLDLTRFGKGQSDLCFAGYGDEIELLEIGQGSGLAQGQRVARVGSYEFWDAKKDGVWEHAWRD